MRHLNKTLIACLLIVAIPVQGFAAVAMQMCVPGHHGTTSAAAQQHGDEHLAQAVHQHHDESTNVKVASGTTSDLGHGKCSACASCSIALAIVNSVLIGASHAASSVEISFTAQTFASHISDRLDPPPRPLLA